MKTTLAIICTLSILSFRAIAAPQIDSQAISNQHLHGVGTITVSCTDGSPSEIYKALSDKTDAQGAKAYRITEMHEGSAWHATAEIYR